ncbi:MAG: isoaspartyl peptidase/L-asparaginase [Planctomycetota bacterium]|jgi:N4-(beta-N-acetylglucosaminyl)-L-asparaginase|nr:asparaginase [Planctomycetota bacterium]MDP6838543.1 isoaspartyl peptidase/L-asparaginase [Planctomycetota bacterium]
MTKISPSRRELLGAALAAGAAPAATARSLRPLGSIGNLGLQPQPGKAVLIGSANALAGMRQHYAALAAGGQPLDAALAVVGGVEADPLDHSVGLGGLPNEDGVVQLDSAVMDGEMHNSGAVACIENILHPSQVARLVMERTDHCMIVGRGAYEFARGHGHAHTELSTEASRKIWLRWKETMSERDDRLPPATEGEEHGSIMVDGERVAVDELCGKRRITGTIHCSALSAFGTVACTTTTSGLSWKIPGRVGDSPIIGAGLYCDGEVGSAGATGRGEAAILSTGSSTIVELMRAGLAPLDAGLELLRRVTRQVKRASAWQPALWDAEGGADGQGAPAFGLKFYIVNLSGEWAGVSLRGGGKFSVADAAGGPRHEDLVALHP